LVKNIYFFCYWIK